MSGKLKVIKVINVPVGDIIPYAQNARIHSEEQTSQIENSIREFGYTLPVLIDRNYKLVAGHGRLAAAIKLEMTHIPAIQLEDLTPNQIKAYRIADNKIAANAGWDEDLLRDELEYLLSAEVDFNADLTGFSTPEIDLLLHSDPVPEVEDEHIPAPDPENTVSKSGDSWVLEPHHIIVGDCCDSLVIDTLMDGALAQMVLTDPPYNVAIHGHVSGLGKNQHREFPMASGEMSSVEFTEFLTAAFTQFVLVSVDGALQFVFMDWRHITEILQAGKSVYNRLVNLCVWSKNNGGMGSLYRSAHELVFVFKHGTASHVNNVQLGKHGRYRTNCWHYQGSNSFGRGREESLSWHPTVKPVAMLMDAIMDVTHPGDIVLDGFLGSGSTLIAAERTRRVCYGVELDPAYVDVTIRRRQHETGQQAVLACTGQTFDEVAVERGIQRGIAV